MLRSFFLLFVLGCYGKVGIKTSIPKGVFHIDAKGNTTEDTRTTSDDVVVLLKGNVGIGTLAPETELHMVRTLQIEDGNQEQGMILTSDADGSAYW